MKYYKLLNQEGYGSGFKEGEIYSESLVSGLNRTYPEDWQEITELNNDLDQMHKDLLISIYSLDVPMKIKHELANKTVDALVKTSDHYMTKMIKP